MLQLQMYIGFNALTTKLVDLVIYSEIKQNTYIHLPVKAISLTPINGPKGMPLRSGRVPNIFYSFSKT